MEHTQIRLPAQEVLLYSLNHIERLSNRSHSKTAQEVFQDWTLLITTEGQGRLVVDGAAFPVKRGSGFLLTPGTGVAMETEEQGLGLYQLQFETVCKTAEGYSRIHSIPNSGLLEPGAVACHPFSQGIVLLESLHQHYSSSAETEQFANHIRFQELLLLLYGQKPAANEDNLVRGAVEHSISYLKQHFNEPLTVDGLAAMADIKRSRYTRVFKEITGQIPLDYLNRLRIDRAQQLLLLTHDRLHTIAQTVGFSNEYYFNRRFKGTVGLTPGQYRRSHQDNIRVFAPFLEDYLLALGIIPVAQYCHAQWGKQDYLGLHQIPQFEISSGNWAALSPYEPELIMLNDGYERWRLEECRQIAPLFKVPFMGEDWRATLRTVGSIFGRTAQVAEVISSYEQKAAEAKATLSRTVRGQTVAFLRISACGVILYGGEELGFTGGVLYKDLGLRPHPLVQQLTQGERRAELTKEGLARLDAQHLFITFDKREGEGRELLDTPLWSSLPAVRNRCVYEVDFMAWMNYGVLSHRRKIEDVLKVLA